MSSLTELVDRLRSATELLRPDEIAGHTDRVRTDVLPILGLLANESSRYELSEAFALLASVVDDLDRAAALYRRSSTTTEAYVGRLGLGPVPSASDTGEQDRGRTRLEGLGPLERLGPSEQKAVRSLRSRIDEHQAKLDAYLADPDSADHLDILEGKTPEVRQRIIHGRAKHLRQEISAFRDGIDKIFGGE